MSQRSLRLTLLATAVALSGCTVYVNQKPPPRTQTARQTTPKTPTGPRAAAVAPRATTTASTPTKPAASDAPRIKGSTIFGNGTAGAFRGLVYVIPNDSQKLPDTSKLVPFAQLFTDSFLIQPQEFSGGFPGVLVQEEWFEIRYEGLFEVPKDATYTFTLASDDGANLYIDNEKVVDNDGLHVPKTATGSKALKAGRHSLRLDYFQGNKGPVALALSMSDNTTDKSPRPLVGVR